MSLYGSFGAVDHGYTVAGSNQWIGSVSFGIRLRKPPAAMMVILERKVSTSPVFSVQYISAAAFGYPECSGLPNDAQVVLGNDFYRQEICRNTVILDVVLFSFNQAVLYFRACIVFVVDAELRMSAFFMRSNSPLSFVKVSPIGRVH